MVQLASLLEIDVALAQRALQQCQWNYEASFNAACELASASASSNSTSSSSSSSSSASAQPARGRSLASPSNHSLSSSRDTASIPFGVHPAFSSNGLAQPSTNRPNGNRMNHPAQMPSGLGTSSASPAPRAMSDPPENKRPQAALAHDAPDVFVSASDPLAKRRRLAIISPKAATFKIPNNNADPPAANPPLLQAYPLREEQRRSLGWMLSQETKLPECADDDSDDDDDGASDDASADWDSGDSGDDDDRTFPLRGGLLADRMGYGKTSTTIGLLSLDAERPLRQPGRAGVPLLKRDGSRRCIPSDTTLIVCPSHLVDQWEREFWKFLGPNGVQMSRPQVACSGRAMSDLKCRGWLYGIRTGSIASVEKSTARGR